MSILICDYAPIDLVACKSKSPTKFSIAGSGVAHTDIIRGLLRYGTYERYYFIEQNAIHSSPKEIYTKQELYSELIENIDDGRANILTIPELAQIDATGQVVFFSTGPYLHGLYNLQQLLKCFKSPCVGITHSLNGPNLLPVFLGSILHQSQSANALICTSNAGRQVVEGQFLHMIQSARLPMTELPFRCPVIPLGVNSEYFKVASKRGEARRYHGIDNDEVVIISIGRFAMQSKADLRPLLLAFAKLRESCSANIRLILAGDDTKESAAKSLLQFSQLLGIEPFISIQPNIKHTEKMQLLAAADIFVAPSDNIQETFGISVVEAMAAGLPVVAADWNGFKDTVVDGQTGILVPTILPKYEFPIEALSPVGSVLAHSLLAQTTTIDISRLTEALKVFVENQDYRRKAGELAYKRAREHYHIKKIILSYEQLWENLLEESAGKQTTGAGECLYSFPASDIFAHYATKILSGKEKVAITDQGVFCLNGELNLLSQIADSENMFRIKNLTLILKIIRDEGPISAETIEQKYLKNEQYHSIVFRAVIARLLKFGLIHCIP